MKKLVAIFILLVFALFTTYIKLTQNTHKVLYVDSPTEIVVDLNNDNKAEQEEHIPVDLISFSTQYNNPETLKNLNLSKEDGLRLGYLVENYAKNLLDRKHVEVRDGKIFVDYKNYDELLYNEGFALHKDEKITEKLAQNLTKARKLNLVLLNNNNNKYHKLDCKFAQEITNKTIILKSQLPKYAEACNFCFQKEVKVQKKFKISQIAEPSLTYTDEDIKVFLTNFKGAKPTPKCDTDICKSLVQEINSAQKTIDFAIYGYTKIPALENALKRAQARGVRIRMVYDMEYNQNLYPDTVYLSQIIKFNNNDVVPELMHNKFFIFDSQKVFTGSANISTTDMSGFNANASILVNSPAMAELYEQEFNQMFLGKFHLQKGMLTKQDIILKNGIISCYFSPRDKAIKRNIIPLIDEAQRYIYVPAFILTHYDLSKALIKAKKRGVDVKIILDATNTVNSRIKELREANIPVKTEIFAGKMHSKSILIDDRYTIIGSMNFSKSGESANDENVVIIQNSAITKFYKNYFLYLWHKIPNKWLTFTARAESIDSIGSCHDGIDNDFDGKIDSLDEGCQKVVFKKYKKQK